VPLHIDGPQSGELSAAIRSACDDVFKLQRVLLNKLDENVWTITSAFHGLEQVVFDVIRHFNSRYRIDALVVAMLEAYPENALLLKFAWRHEILARRRDPGAELPPDRALERMLDPVRGFANPMEFLDRLARVIRCVCRIEVPTDQGSQYGTGFLVGNSSVLTNYHVMQNVLEASRGATPGRVTLLFDYVEGVDGKQISPGVSYALADDWLIDFSPYHPLDLGAQTLEDNLATERPTDYLDFALLRVKESPGLAPSGAKPEPGAVARGCVPYPGAGCDFASDSHDAALFIVQHPAKGRLAFDWDKPAILGFNPNNTRVLYKINTLGGSSGSPCFNAKMEWVALHHAGDPDWSIGHQPNYNRGIPARAIWELLEKRGKLGEIQ
jgi:hypothetical protein